MILVNDRYITIPDNDVFITSEKIVLFKVNSIDETRTYLLFVKRSDDIVVAVELTKQIYRDHTTLEWRVLPEHLKNSGIISISLKVICSDNQAWTTREDYLVVLKDKETNESVNVDYQRGYKDGYEKGLFDGKAGDYDLGYTEGKQDGITEGYNNGYEQGKVDGYKDGYNEGYSKGYSEGYEKGKSEGFDVDAYFEQKFNAVTLNGTRTNCANLFYNSYVDDLTFKPTCDIKPVNASGMFTSCLITNLLQILEDRNVVLDMSNCTKFTQWIHNSTIIHLPCISLEGLPTGGNTETVFYNAVKLVYIAKIITRKDLVWAASSFANSKALTTIEEIEGEIGSSFNISSCSQLDDLTVDNIVNAYADMTGQTAPVLTVHAIVKAKIVADDAKEDTDPIKRFWLRTLTSKNVTLA